MSDFTREELECWRMPFGLNHYLGKTLREVLESGNRDWLQMLAGAPRWKGIWKYAGAKERIEAFLALPDVKAAVERACEAKRAKTTKVKAGAGLKATNAFREQATLWGW